MTRNDTQREGGRIPRDWSRAASGGRVALLWEQAWPPLAAFLCVAGLFLAFSWAGFWLLLPFALRMAMLAGFLLAAAAALYPLRRLRMPDEAAILARLDRASARPHRPVMALSDRPAGPDASPGDPLWQAHLQRMRRRLGTVGAGLPSPGMARRDPLALRAAILLIAVVAFVQAGDERASRLAAVWAGPAAADAPPGRMDAWISPPAYTGRAPVLLDTGSQAVIEVPEASRFILRSERPGMAVRFHPESGEPQPVAAAAPGNGAAGEFSHELTGNGTITVEIGERTISRWPIAVLDDAPPSIRLTSPPALAPTGELELNYAIGDDYGVVSALAETALQDEAAGSAEPLVPPPAFDLVLPKAAARSGEARTRRDIRDHPWAGVPVRLTLKATDAAGQHGYSEPAEIVLPARPFSRPLARAIVEQRRLLALDRERREHVARALRALTLVPARIDGAAAYLGLRTAYRRIDLARSDDELRGVLDYLWEIALAIEDGAMSLAARNLRDAQERLQQALENDASDEEISRLMDELRQAMAEFLNELAGQAGDPQNLPELSPEQMQQSMSPGDLQRLMDRIEELARSGARDAARELLSQLRSMMENLQMARPGQPGQQQQDMARTLEELNDLMRRQQELMDRTFDMNRQGEGEGQDQNGREGLAGEQQALREALEELMARMRERGLNPQEGMGEAGEAMGEAEGNIGQNQLGDAVDDQGRALDGLRRGAQSMMEQLQSQMAGEGGGQGPTMGRAPTDPLGRPRDQRGTDLGLGVKTPEIFDAEQARRILQELRRRLSEPTLPSGERDYLERLIEGF